MAKARFCPSCGTAITQANAEGLCPRCLLNAAMGEDAVDQEASDQELDPGDEYCSPEFAPTMQPQPRFIVPEIASIADLFPHLEFQSVLGRGGMGAVYKVRQVKLDRVAALKIIRPDTATDPAFAERFNREARTLAKLNHPHIVGIYDFGEVDFKDPASSDVVPLYYFLMEFVDGVNLRQIIQSQPLPSAQALAIVPQVCKALQFAHDHGIVHRDIKPENILLNKTGHVKIADFGLAKFGADAADFTLTATHQILGTVRYMAPEQMARSSNVDHRADIYSLGVVLYEMLTGEIPAGAFEPPSTRAAVDSRLDAVVLRAMASDPGRRYQSVSEVASHVDTISSSSQPARPTATPQFAESPGPSTIIDNGIGAIAEGLRGMFDRSPVSDVPTFDTDAESTGDSYVEIPQHLIETQQLPNICMVCGRPTTRRQSHEFSYTSDLSGGIIVVLMIFFFPAGILAAIMLTKKVRVSCPVCVAHKNHWSCLAWFAGLGWMLIPIGVFAGLYLGGFLYKGQRDPWILLPCILAGVAAYVVPLVWLGVTRVSASEISEHALVLKRVSAAFANSVLTLARKKTPADNMPGHSM